MFFLLLFRHRSQWQWDIADIAILDSILYRWTAQSPALDRLGHCALWCVLFHSSAATFHLWRRSRCATADQGVPGESRQSFTELQHYAGRKSHLLYYLYKHILKLSLLFTHLFRTPPRWRRSRSICAALRWRRITATRCSLMCPWCWSLPRSLCWA